MIAIKGIKMPKKCMWDCQLCREDGGACQLSDIRTSDIERPEDCPLVEIVTCKDCKHLSATHSCNASRDHRICPDDFYCANAERKE